MRRPSAGDAGEWVRVAMLAAGTYFGVKILSSLTDKGPPGPDEQSNANCTEPATLSPQQLAAMAEAIEWALHGFTEDESEVVRQIGKVNVCKDLQALIVAFGQRRLSVFGIGPYSLPSAVATYLSASDIGTINSDLQRKGINFRF